MNKIILYILLLLHVNLYSNTQNIDNNKELKSLVKFGFVSSFQILVDYKDARDSLSSWVEKIGNKKYVELKVLFYDTKEELFNDYLNGNLDMIVLDFDFYTANRLKVNEISDFFWSMAFLPTKELSYCLAKRKDLVFNDYFDLKNRVISIKKMELLPNDWIDKRTLENTNLQLSQIAKKILYESKESTLLLNVFFKKSDYAVIRKETWKTMIELNPAIEKNLELLECSKTNFAPFLGFFSKKLSKANKELFFDVVGKLSKYEDSEQLFSILNFDHIFEIQKEQIDDILDFYNQYNSLKQKYVK